MTTCIWVRSTSECQRICIRESWCRYRHIQFAQWSKYLNWSVQIYANSYVAQDALYICRPTCIAYIQYKNGIKLCLYQHLYHIDILTCFWCCLILFSIVPAVFVYIGIIMVQYIKDQEREVTSQISNRQTNEDYYTSDRNSKRTDIRVFGINSYQLSSISIVINSVSWSKHR